MNKKKRKSFGFTLIEVLIAIAIFSFIALGTTGAITRSLKVKKMAEEQWNDIHALRTALTIMQRDISLAFHKSNLKPTFGLSSQKRDQWFRTFFKSRNNQLNFTSLTHRKIYEDAHESNLCEIGYQLSPDPHNAAKSNITRRLSIYVDDDPEEGGKTQVLLENVKSLEFRFYSKEKDRWLEDWDSEHPDFKDKFPEAVQISMTLLSQGKETKYVTKVLIANPANLVSSEGLAPEQKPNEPPAEEKQKPEPIPGDED